MVTIKKQVKGKQTYYYLEHSFREKGKVQKKQKYLGKEIQEDVEETKKQFFLEIYNDLWLNKIDKIRENFSKEKRIMPPSAKEKELESFMIKFTYNTQKIEGSSLSLKETANLLERGITPSEKPIRDVKEAEAHKKVFYSMLKYTKDLSLQICLFWNKLLLEGTKPDIAGKIRNHQVAISQSKFMPPMPSELDFLLKDFFDWYNKNKRKLHPAVLAALVHLKFVTIHPFADGNGRISRIMMNFIFKKNGFPMLNVEYINRNSYYHALERSQIKKQDNIFLQWFMKRYIKEYERYLK
ncbi:Fic family protein [Candidatus Woesearchaeota archaeon]|nr:Fic family protein [Candidatus Woesearchaeota archaeon]